MILSITVPICRIIVQKIVDGDERRLKMGGEDED